MSDGLSFCQGLNSFDTEVPGVVIIQRLGPQSGQIAGIRHAVPTPTSARRHQHSPHRLHAISGRTPLMVNDGNHSIQMVWSGASGLSAGAHFRPASTTTFTMDHGQFRQVLPTVQN